MNGLVTDLVTTRKRFVTASVHDDYPLPAYSTGMVTRKRSPAIPTIGNKSARRVYLREHREAKGYTPVQMAGRVGIERESYYRLERETWRVKGGRQSQLEDILELEPGGLWKPPLKEPEPQKQSLDDLVKDATPEQRDMLFDVARRILGKTG